MFLAFTFVAARSKIFSNSLVLFLYGKLCNEMACSLLWSLATAVDKSELRNKIWIPTLCEVVTIGSYSHRGKKRKNVICSMIHSTHESFALRETHRNACFSPRTSVGFWMVASKLGGILITDIFIKSEEHSPGCLNKAKVICHIHHQQGNKMGQ